MITGRARVTSSLYWGIILLDCYIALSNFNSREADVVLVISHHMVLIAILTKTERCLCPKLILPKVDSSPHSYQLNPWLVPLLSSHFSSLFPNTLVDVRVLYWTHFLGFILCHGWHSDSEGCWSYCIMAFSVHDYGTL